ncbi:MAG: TolC family protein [Candidatus Latescibacteria bacterium]|jgi:outer membrane protein TolC|nr:TolC family protein [Candidatus Latescibacterota bacterium]
MNVFQSNHHPFNTCRLKSMCLILSFIASLSLPHPCLSQTIDLTLEQAVSIAMENSYRIRRLELGIERTRLFLKARRAQLKSSVALELKSPEFKKVSDYKWNSTLQRDEIVRQNTRLWEGELSVSQPVILFGYPTNGYLSLNSRTYRYNQQKNESKNTTWYNRYFVRFKQPIFQPNFLKNNITEAELDLEGQNLRYISDQVDLIDDISDDYFDLFEEAYRSKIYANEVENLERVLDIAETAADDDPDRKIELLQVQLELGNSRERLLRNKSRVRSETEHLRGNIGLSKDVLVTLDPEIDIRPLEVNTEEAIQYGLSLRPRLRALEIEKKKEEIDLDNTKGRNAFHLDLELTYGLEKQDETFNDLWSQYDNSYSVSVEAYIPIWDWGRRKTLIEADKISLRRSELAIEEFQEKVETDIRNAIEDLQEFQRRTLTMEEHVETSESLIEASVEQYEDGKMALQDLLRSIKTQSETGRAFLDAYLGYRKSTLSLMTKTYYDFEFGQPLVERFQVRER